MGMELKKLEDQIRNLNLEESGGKRDLLPLYADSKALDALVKYLAEPFRGKVDYVCSPEPLGFIVGSMLARELGVGLVVIRRNQQFWIDPEEQVTASYINHRDKVTVLVTERKLLPAGSRVLLADDWMSTAATMQACATVIEEAGCKVAGFAAVGADDQSSVRNVIDAGSVRFVYSEK
jgi:adenine/guanine phosphoribosyltransferase-like PRPP-binding protein